MPHETSYLGLCRNYIVPDLHMWPYKFTCKSSSSHRTDTFHLRFIDASRLVHDGCGLWKVRLAFCWCLLTILPLRHCTKDYTESSEHCGYSMLLLSAPLNHCLLICGTRMTEWYKLSGTHAWMYSSASVYPKRHFARVLESRLKLMIEKAVRISHCGVQSLICHSLIMSSLSTLCSSVAGWPSFILEPMCPRGHCSLRVTMPSVAQGVLSFGAPRASSSVEFWSSIGLTGCLNCCFAFRALLIHIAHSLR